jgi:hypothetical protein
MTAAGWYEGRALSVEVLHRWEQQLGKEGFRMSAPAAVALAEFGGLRVEQRAAGVDMSRETFEFDPTLAIGERDRFLRFESPGVGRLFPLGEAAGGHAFLAISDAGHAFLLADSLLPIGSSIEEAIRNLVEGRRFPPGA